MTGQRPPQLRVLRYSASVWGWAAIFVTLITAVPAQEAAEVAAVVDENAVGGQEAEEEAQPELAFDFNVAMGDPQTMLLQRHLRVNCALARRCCKLSADQERAFAKLDAAWLEAEIKQAADGPVALERAAVGIARFLGGRANPVRRQNQPAEVIRAVQKSIDLRIRALLDDEQRAVFEEECTAREDFRRQALADVLVLAIDQRLYLDETQREDLQAAVVAWLKKENKDLYWQFYFQNQAYIPQIPKSVLETCLVPEQRLALKGMNGHNYEFDQMQLQMIGHQVWAVIAK